MKKIYYFTKEKNKNSYYMIIKTGNEFKIELKERLNEKKKKQNSIKKINEENREEVLILKFKLKKIMKQY